MGQPGYSWLVKIWTFANNIRGTFAVPHNWVKCCCSSRTWTFNTDLAVYGMTSLHWTCSLTKARRRLFIIFHYDTSPSNMVIIGRQSQTSDWGRDYNYVSLQAIFFKKFQYKLFFLSFMFFNEAGIPIEKKNILVCSGFRGIKFLRPKLYEVNLQGSMSE